MSEFIDRCSVLMGERGISQIELADIIGKPYKSVNNWFSKRGMSPKTEDAVKIALALKTSVEYLVTGVDSRYDGLGENHKAFQKYIDMRTEEQLGDLKHLLEAISRFYKGEAKA